MSLFTRSGRALAVVAAIAVAACTDNVVSPDLVETPEVLPNDVLATWINPIAAEAQLITLDVASHGEGAASRFVKQSRFARPACDLAKTDSTFKSGTYHYHYLFACDDAEDADGLVMSRSYRMFDSAGEEMDHYDAAVTDSIRYTISMEVDTLFDGAVINGVTYYVERAYTLTQKGLKGNNTTETWSGKGSDYLYKPGATLQDLNIDLEGAFKITDVVLNVGSDYPQSGTMTLSYSGQMGAKDGNKFYNMPTGGITATVTFNGTAQADMVFEWEGYTKTYALNLDNGTLTAK
jgi:hypothetical protein